MIAMSAAPWVKPLRHAICAATLALAVIGTGHAAWAQAAAAAATADDDIEDHILNADKRLLDAILKPFGLGSASGPDIIYRERSPLVVPQTRDLPPPGKAAKSGDWPVDPTVKQAKKEAAADRRFNPSGKAQYDASRSISGTAENWKTGDTGSWADPPKPRQEPDFFKMLFSGALVGTWEETAKFEGESPRNSLVDPPPGYLTPSPAAPYGATPRAGQPEPKEKKL
jgi:hypothetical protein